MHTGKRRQFLGAGLAPFDWGNHTHKPQLMLIPSNSTDKLSRTSAPTPPKKHKIIATSAAENFSPGLYLGRVGSSLTEGSLLNPTYVYKSCL
ncbi:MAG: hypothetical protein MUE44_31900 [Oscillatoriaceae cyanobacterium Prado104]|nr:hypothetical protein [Oscillatoriaceae cyanobacterium Prado104]